MDSSVQIDEPMVFVALLLFCLIHSDSAVIRCLYDLNKIENFRSCFLKICCMACCLGCTSSRMTFQRNPYDNRNPGQDLSVVQYVSVFQAKLPQAFLGVLALLDPHGRFRQ